MGILGAVIYLLTLGVGRDLRKKAEYSVLKRLPSIDAKPGNEQNAISRWNLRPGESSGRVRRICGLVELYDDGATLLVYSPEKSSLLTVIFISRCAHIDRI